MALGDPKAPNVVIEYASMTCPHCQRFHQEVYPRVQDEVHRHRQGLLHLPRLSRSTRSRRRRSWWRIAGRRSASSRSSTCSSTTRSEWAFVQDPVTALQNLVKQAGISEDEFNACLTNQSLLDGVNWVKDRATKEFGVNATPTFFINGKKYAGEQTLAGPGQASGRLRPRFSAGDAVEIHAAARARIQVVRRADRTRHRARADRRRRAERVRQIEPCRGAPLGDGRELLQGHARVRDGRRDLPGERQPPGAQHRRSVARRRQFRPRRARTPSTTPT